MYYMMNDFEAFYICSRNQNETGCGIFLCAHRLYKVLTIQTKKDMEIKIQISDAVYAQLLNGSKRMRGSIGLVSPKEGNFSAYQCKPMDKKRTFMKLPHGRVSVGDADVRMTLRIEQADYLYPSQVLEQESQLACDYVDMMIETLNA